VIALPSVTRATGHPPDPILSPLIFEPATLIGSSAALQWRGVLLEKYACNSGERSDDDSLERPVIVMLCSPLWRGERKLTDGAFHPFSETLGALAVVPKGPLSAMRSGQQGKFIFCAFDESFVSTVRDELEGRCALALGERFGFYDRAISEILNLLFGELQSGCGSGVLYAESLVHALTIRLLFLGENRQAPSRAAARLPLRKLRRVQELIESRLDGDVTLDRMASEVGYSRSHFLRMFHETTGLTPHRYVLRQRVERARRLLEQPGIGIAEVACCCGFSSQAHLTVAFRKECGVTPAEYRRRH
jgi:AraC family transcriptional regulator